MAIFFTDDVQERRIILSATLVKILSQLIQFIQTFEINAPSGIILRESYQKHQRLYLLANS